MGANTTVKLKLKIVSHLAAVFLLAYALKSFYSSASVNDLRWILAPTTFFVELITGKQFTFESQAGYMSSDHTFLIAASCSGVNFLVISFLVLGLGEIRRVWHRRVQWRALPIAMLSAYIATIIANTTRIIVALYSQNIQTSWIDHDELHRVQGIVIYFGFLLALFIASERSASVEGSVWNIGSIDMSRSVHLLVIYYAVTLGIPLVRGSYRDPGFWQHAPVVLLIPIALIIPLAVGVKVKNLNVRNLFRRKAAAV